MAHMAGNFGRYSQLLYLFTKFDLSIHTTYLINFFAGVVGKLLRVFLIMLFFKTLVLRVPGIPQWNEMQLYVLAVTFYVTDLIASILFHRNLLYHLPRMIRDGTFDRILVKPIPQLFHAAFNRIDMQDMLAFIPFIYFWVYIIQHFDVPATPGTIALYIVLVLNAVVFTFALVLLLGSTSFWLTRGDGFGRLVDHATGSARFPFDIFPEKFKFVVFYIVPVALLATVPTQALLRLAAPLHIVYSVAFTVVLLFVALLVWRKGVNVYQSASS
jgi:ABC-2 type transport system permease protein